MPLPYKRVYMLSNTENRHTHNTIYLHQFRVPLLHDVRALENVEVLVACGGHHLFREQLDVLGRLALLLKPDTHDEARHEGGATLRDDGRYFQVKNATCFV